ncbi:MAG: Holliday junction branch migration protein RuvA [Candidatus Taylorbacteria bacterium]|nr:Holliday junction branch migration protein RuvA [Candidatus Taylorbacteria bacterium]
MLANIAEIGNFCYDGHMISHLTGSVIHTDERFAVIETSGVGYKVFMTPETLHSLQNKKGGTANVWTYLAVRENALDLYGFIEKSELDFFELLVSHVSGVGPKTALGILSVTTIKNLRQAIGTSDTSHLTKISGIGKKVAEKIVMELRDKIDFLESEKDTGEMRDESDAIEGLKALGYAEREAREALKKLPKEISRPSDKIKQALKLLGK